MSVLWVEGEGYIPPSGGGDPSGPPEGLHRPRRSPRIGVGTSRSLAGPWTDAPWLIAGRCVRGVGNRIGTAELRSLYGRLNDPQLADDVVDAPDRTPAPGTLIRIQVAEGDEAPADLWHGVVDVIERDPDERAAVVRAVELPHLLTLAYLWRGWERSAAGVSLADPGGCPDFNAFAGGDRSAAPWQGSHHVHDRTGAGVPWQARDIAELLLHRAAWGDLDPTSAGSEGDAVRFRLGTVDGDYQPARIKAAGRSVWDILQELASHRTGLLWRHRVADGTCFLDLIRTDAAPVDIDLSGDPYIADAKVDAGDRGYDVVIVQGRRPLTTVTLLWDAANAGASSLVPDGWSPGAAANAVVNAALVAAASAGSAPYDGAAWRRWKLAATWDGRSDGLPGDGVRSNADDDGNRQWFADGPSPVALELSRETSLAEGWGITAEGPRQAAAVVAGRSALWVDLSTRCPVAVAGDGDRVAGLTLGATAEDADTLRLVIGTAGKLYVTVGIREGEPLQCRALRPAEDWRIPGLPRVLLRQVDAEERVACGNLVTGVTASESALVRSGGSPLTVASDRAKLAALRDRMAAWYLAAVSTASWTDRGRLDRTRQPGDVVGQLTIREGEAYTIGQPIMAVVYDLSDAGLSTGYEVARPATPAPVVG